MPLCKFLLRKIERLSSDLAGKGAGKGPLASAPDSGSVIRKQESHVVADGSCWLARAEPLKSIKLWQWVMVLLLLVR